jgi:hypothetical protein
MKKSTNPMHLAPRCGAHARTTGKPCQSPAIKGKARCRMHGGKSPGRPKTHGRFTKEAIADRKRYYSIFREARRVLKEINEFDWSQFDGH